MVKIVSVSLPDDLYKRLQKTKEQINVSGVFQQALESKIELCEIKMKGKGMKETIEKLRKQKEQCDQSYFDQGKTSGLKDAQDMDYKELLEVMNFADNEVYQTDFYHNWLADPIKELCENDSAFNEDKYLEGWVEGVKEFFEKVKDELA